VDNVVDMCRKIKDAKIPFVLNLNNSWESFEHSLLGIVNTAWVESKFLDDSGTSLHPDMNNIPNDTGVMQQNIKCLILQAKDNRDYCRMRGIRLSGPKLENRQSMRKREKKATR